jgi:hypothetical protein
MRFNQRQKIKALEKENRDLKSKVPEEKPPESLEEKMPASLEEKPQEMEATETPANETPADATLEFNSESEK